MLLTSFKYKTPNWEISRLTNLGAANLLVGQNASGKSRTIHALESTAHFMRAVKSLHAESDFSVEITFLTEDSTPSKLEYSFSVKNEKITKELLKKDNHTILRRSGATAILEGDPVNPPENKLITQVRRDKKLYPEIERLMEWAEGVTAISFSDINPFTNALGPSLQINPKLFSDLVSEFTSSEKKMFLKEAREIGYSVSDIRCSAFRDYKFVEIKENYIKSPVAEFNLSNGMIRVLYVLAYLIKMKNRTTTSLLLIDDLGEGLDYKKVVKLGEKVFLLCQTSGVQIIATSNDSHLMDIVDISKWQILNCNRSTVTSLNASTHPDLFNAFRLTGLSNYDFFSSDFIDNFLKNSR